MLSFKNPNKTTSSPRDSESLRQDRLLKFKGFFGSKMEEKSKLRKKKKTANNESRSAPKTDRGHYSTAKVKKNTQEPS